MALRWVDDSGGVGRGTGAVGGVRRGGVRAAEQVRSAGQGADVPAWAAVGRAAQVDAADGRAPGGGPSGVAAVCLLSTWAVEPVRARLARRAVALIAPDAWVVDDTGFPKDGTASPGVARQYCGSLGKVGNCQIGVSVDAVTDAASCPLNWRLFLSASWDDAGAATPEAAAAIRARRARAGIPAGERHRPKWALALEMLDELAGWGLRPPVVVADAGYGNNADFRAGIAARGAHYIVQVDGDLSAHPAEATPELRLYSGRGRRSRPRYRTRPVGLRAHALAAGRAATVQITWRQGSRGSLTSHFLA